MVLQCYNTHYIHWSGVTCNQTWRRLLTDLFNIKIFVVRNLQKFLSHAVRLIIRTCVIHFVMHRFSSSTKVMLPDVTR